MSKNDKTVTMVKDAIHNPADARHFMRLGRPNTPSRRPSTAPNSRARRERSRLKEVGFDIYDPVIYFPRDDVQMDRLQKNEKSTHCPLKGDTEYFDAVTDKGTVDNAAWSYDRAIEIAKEIENYIGFDVRYTQIVEHTVQS